MFVFRSNISLRKTRKPNSQIQFCNKILIIDNLSIKRDIPNKLLRNSIFVESNTKCFTEFTNCNLSQLVELTLLSFNDVEEHDVPSNCTKSYFKLGEGFFSAVT